MFIGSDVYVCRYISIGGQLLTGFYWRAFFAVFIMAFYYWRIAGVYWRQGCGDVNESAPAPAQSTHFGSGSNSGQNLAAPMAPAPGPAPDLKPVL